MDYKIKKMKMKQEIKNFMKEYYEFLYKAKLLMKNYNEFELEIIENSNYEILMEFLQTRNNEDLNKLERIIATFNYIENPEDEKNLKNLISKQENKKTRTRK